MKKSSFIPVALEYDTDDLYLEDIFRLKTTDRLAIFSEATRRGREYGGNPTDSKIFMDMVEEKLIDGNMILYLASLGFTKIASELKPGLDLVYYASHPEEDS